MFSQSFFYVLITAIFQISVFAAPFTNVDISIADQDPCNVDVRSLITIFISQFPVTFPIPINQYFESNTVINIDFFGAYTINNAPTSLVTTVTGTSTTTATSTVTATTTVTNTAVTTLPAASVAPEAFVLGFERINDRRRQESNSLGYIGSSGKRTGSCASANQFIFNGAQVEDVAGNGFISANSGEQVATVSPSNGDIKTSFYSFDQDLIWQNSAFSGGLASFFYDAAQDIIVAVFDAAYDVTDLVPIKIVTVPVSSCSAIAPFPANSTAPITLPGTVISPITTAIPTSNITAIASSSTTPIITSAASSTTSTASSTTSSTQAATTTYPPLTDTTQNGKLNAGAVPAEGPGIGAGKNEYNFYKGDGSVADGWPETTEWVSYEDMFANNLAIIEKSCTGDLAQNSPAEIQAIRDSIDSVAADSGVDRRFILATILQESGGCVRVGGTNFGVNNPGLMQSHDGAGSCNKDDTISNPCPDSVILQMIEEGTGGTFYRNSTGAINEGEGLVQGINRVFGAYGATGAQAFYIGSRNYNSGFPRVDSAGKPVLEAGCATLCYSSDIANRLVGWAPVDSTIETNAECTSYVTETYGSTELAC